jgi:hypothetical protein
MDNSLQALSRLIEINESRPIEMKSYMSYVTPNGYLQPIHNAQDYHQLHSTAPELCIGCLLGNYLQSENQQELRKLLETPGAYYAVALELNLSKIERGWLFLKSVWTDMFSHYNSKKGTNRLFTNENFDDRESVLLRAKKLYWYKYYKNQGVPNPVILAYQQVHNDRVESR